MAGDWIPMRIGIEADPAVLRIAAATKLDVYGVVGRLQKLWGWANANLTDGTAAGVNFTLLDCIVGVSGFCSAMSSAGWLIEDESGVSFPKFEAWNSQSAKQRALTRNRVATHAAKANAKPNARANGKPNAKANAKPNAQLTLDALGKEENRREEKEDSKTPPPPVPGEGPKTDGATVPPVSPPPPPPPAKRKTASVDSNFDPLAVDLPFKSDRFREAWSNWVEYRRIRKPALTEISVRQQLKDFVAWGEESAIVAIGEAIRNQWQGLFQPKGGTVNGGRPFKSKLEQEQDYIMSQIESLTE